MKFTDYLEDVLGTRSRIEILRVMVSYPTKEFTENELSSLIDVSQKTVNRSMSTFVDQGILNVKSIGKANVYSVNSDQYIVEQLQDLYERERKAREELKSMLGNSFRKDDDLISLAIFGSVAEEREGPTSDVDVFILTRDKGATIQKLEEVRDRIERRFGNAISEYILTPEEFENKLGEEPLDSILSSGELILGRPLDQVSK